MAVGLGRYLLKLSHLEKSVGTVHLRQSCASFLLFYVLVSKNAGSSWAPRWIH